MKRPLKVSLCLWFVTCVSAMAAEPLPPGAVARIGGQGIWHPGGQGVLLLDDGATVLTFPGRRGVKGVRARFWSVQTCSELDRKLQEGEHLRDQKLCPDGKRFVGFSVANWLFRIDPATGKDDLRVGLGKVIGRGHSLSVSADGKRIAAGGHKDSVIVDADAGKILLKLGVTGAGISLSPDGKRVAVAPGQWGQAKHGGRILILDAATGQELARTEDKFGKYFMDISFSSDGKYLLGYCYGRSPSLTVFDGKTGKVVGPIEPERPLRGYRLCGNTLVLVLRGGLEIWDLQKRSKVCEVGPAASGRNGLSLSSDARRLAVMGFSGTVDVFDTTSGQSVLPPGTVTFGFFQAVMEDKPGGAIYTSDQAGRILRWPQGPDGYRLSRKVHQCNGLARLQLMPGRKELLVVEDQAVTVLQTAAPFEKRRLDTSGLGAGNLLVVHPTHSGRKVLAMGTGGGIRALDVPSGSVEILRKPHDQPDANDEADGQLHRADFSNDGRWAWLGRIRMPTLLHIPTGGTTLLEMDRTNLGVFSPRSDLLVTQSRTNLMVWELDSGKLVGKLPGQVGYLETMEFLRGGRVLAVADVAGGIHLLDVVQMRRIGFLQGHGVAPEHGKNYQAYRKSAFVRRTASYSYAPGREQLVSAGYEGRVFVWDVSDFEPLALGLEELSLDGLWERMARAEASAGYPAMLEMSGRKGALAFLSGKLEAAGAVDAAQVAQWASEMDSSSFATRKKAYEKLEDLGPPAGGALRKALGEGEFSPEARRRITALLDSWTQATGVGGLEARRAVRALERIGTPEAREVLGRLARGHEASLLTLSAQAALDRIATQEQESEAGEK